MEIETVESLSNQLADWFGIYGCCKSGEETGCTYDHSKPFCCRMGFISDMEERIRKAVDNDNKLNKIGLK